MAPTSIIQIPGGTDSRQTETHRHTNQAGAHPGLERRGFSLVLLCLSPHFFFCWQHIKFYTSSASCLPPGLLVPGFHLPPSLWRQWGGVPLPMPCWLQQHQHQLCSLQATGKGRRSPEGSPCSAYTLPDCSQAPSGQGTTLIPLIMASGPYLSSLHLPFPKAMTRCLQLKVN